MQSQNRMEKALQWLLALITFLLFFVLVRADAATVAWGSRGDQVRQVQQKLIQYGYLDGTADGVFGKKTLRMELHGEDAAFFVRYRLHYAVGTVRDHGKSRCEVLHGLVVRRIDLDL